MSGHSPTPWTLDPVEKKRVVIHSSDGMYVCIYGDPDDFSLSQVDAEFLVRCVNAHEALTTACQAALGAFERNDAIDWNELVEALKLAGVEP